LRYDQVVRSAFVVPLALEEFRSRLTAAFAAQEELIRRRTPTGLRGAFTGNDEFWIQTPDPHRSNQWNEALVVAPKILCVLETAGPGEVRVVLRLRRRAWSVAVLVLGVPVAVLLLLAVLAAADVFGGVGPVPGMKRLLGLLVGSFACAVLGLLGAWLWGRGDATPARFALLRALGLFGAGRGRGG
jgi:hypothetical protein